MTAVASEPPGEESPLENSSAGASPAGEALVKFSGVSAGSGDQCLFRDFDAVWRRGDVILLTGPSGCGKSTLLSAVARLPARAGMGVDRSRIEFADGAKTGLVFQERALFDDFSVADNIRFGLAHGGRRADRATVAALLQSYRLPSDRAISRMSGGEQQRVALARAAAYRSDILLFDEPTVGLDFAMATQIAEEIRAAAGGGPDLSRSLVVVVTHELGYFLDRPGPPPRLFLFEPAEPESPAPPAESDQPWYVIKEFTADAERSLAEVRKRLDATAGVLKRWSDAGSRGRVGAWGRAGAALRRLATLRGWADSVNTAFPVWQTVAALLLRPAIGGAAALVRGLYDGARSGRRAAWAVPFGMRLMRDVWAWPDAVAYFAVMGLLFGFTLGYFLLTEFPVGNFSLPVFLDRVLAVSTDTLYRAIVPALLGILMAARSGAKVASSLGARAYSKQIAYARSVGASPDWLLTVPLFAAFLTGMFAMHLVMFCGAFVGTFLAYAAVTPRPHLFGWFAHSTAQLDLWAGLTPWRAPGWTAIKLAVSAAAIACFVRHYGVREKASSQAVPEDAVRAVLWSTLAVVVAQSLLSVLEFG